MTRRRTDCPRCKATAKARATGKVPDGDPPEHDEDCEKAFKGPLNRGADPVRELRKLGLSPPPEIGAPDGRACLVCRKAWDTLEQVPAYYATGGEVCDEHRRDVARAYRNAAFAGDPPKGVPERQRLATTSSLPPEIAGAPGGLYLWGGVGRGKSWYAVAVLKARWLAAFQHGHFLSFLWWQEAVLAEATRDAVKNGNAKAMQDSLVATDILVVDDIGTARTTEFAKEQLLLAISQRYDAVRPTIFTSNLSLGKLAERMSDDGADQTGDRIASRIAESCRVIEVKGVDRRTQTGEGR